MGGVLAGGAEPEGERGGAWGDRRAAGLEGGAEPRTRRAEPTAGGGARGRPGEAWTWGSLTRFCTMSSGAADSRVRRRRQSGGAGGGEDWPFRAGTPAMTVGSFSTASFRP